MATHTRYAPDRGLTVRMTATMFLLGLVFVAFVALIIGIMTAAHASGAAIILVAVIFGGGSAFISLFFSDKIALAAAGAQEVTPQQAPELHGVVDRLCALADMDKPRIAIAPTDLTAREPARVRAFEPGCPPGSPGPGRIRETARDSLG